MKHLILLVMTLTVSLAGCGVTTEKFEAQTKELDQCKVDLAYCKRAREEDTAYQRGERDKLEQQVASLGQELDSTRTDLESYKGKAANVLIACVDARHKLETDLETLRQTTASCQAELDRKKAEVTEQEQKANRFREKLQSEIADRNVEISTLRGLLSVRVLDRILFKSGSAEIQPLGLAVLDKLAAVLSTENDMIRIEGHTDNVPIGATLKDKYPSNWELSTARASSVVRYFETSHKIDPLRLEAVGFSYFHPVTDGKTPEELLRNRRVEIVLTPPRQK